MSFSKNSERESNFEDHIKRRSCRTDVAIEIARPTLKNKSVVFIVNSSFSKLETEDSLNRILAHRPL